jgi:hypothetical protein
MKNRYATITIIFGCIAALSLCSCAPTGEDYRRDFVKGCVNKYAKDSTVANEQGRLIVEDYCNCMGDQLNAAMDVEHWRQFNKSNDTALTQFSKQLQPCIEDFHKKVEGITH